MKGMLAVATLALLYAAASPAAAQTLASTYTRFDANQCKHTRGGDVEDYGTWRCAGYGGIDVVLMAGDQRMQVSFGPQARREAASRQTFPAFNSAYDGTIEWRLQGHPGGKPRPFAAILRWNVRLDNDERTATGRVLVITRLGPGGVCHVGYVDARANPDANALARQIADGKAREFKCETDQPIVLGRITNGLTMPKKD